MAGEYYDHTSYPSQGAAGSSSAARAEFELIEAGFDKLPTLTGNGGKLAAINAGGTAMEALTAAQVLTAIGAQAASAKDASGGYAGLTLFKLNLRNAANTFTSFLTNAATAARTWTMQDRDGTVALTNDITGGTLAGSFTTLTASGAATFSAGAVIPAFAADNTYNLNVGNLTTVSNSVVGYPAIGYNLASGNAGNKWRFGGADACSWIQFVNSTGRLYSSTGTPVAGGLIAEALAMSWNATGVTIPGTLGVTGAITATGGIAVEAVLTPTMTNGWGAGVKYWKDSFGVVHLQGSMAAGAAGGAFTLPAGYRPAVASYFPCGTGAASSVSRLDISTAGVVEPWTLAATNLDGITFRTT